MDTCHFGTDEKFELKKMLMSRILLVCWRPILTGKNAFLKRVHAVLHSWGGLEESDAEEL